MGLSAVGARGSLKVNAGSFKSTAGKDIDKMSTIEALQQNFKAAPESLKASIDSFKDGSAVTRMQNLVTNKKPEVTVIDNFNTRNTELGLTINNGGDVPSMPQSTYGDVVAAIIQEMHPKARINKIDIMHKSARESLFQSEGGRDRFINISMAQSEAVRFNTSQVQKVNPSLTNETMQRKNVRPIFDQLVQEADQLNKLTPNNPLSNHVHFLDDIVKGIDVQSSRGTSVFISGGNEPDIYNIFSLGGVNTNRVKSVGALNRDGSIAEYSAQHAGIDTYALGTYSPKPVIGKNNELLGVSVTGNGRVGLPAQQLLPAEVPMGPLPAGEIRFIPYFEINGTSFASPTKLAQTLNKEFPTLGAEHLFGGAQTHNLFPEMME